MFTRELSCSSNSPASACRPLLQ